MLLTHAQVVPVVLTIAVALGQVRVVLLPEVVVLVLHQAITAEVQLSHPAVVIILMGVQDALTVRHPVAVEVTLPVAVVVRVPVLLIVVEVLPVLVAVAPVAVVAEDKLT